MNDNETTGEADSKILLKGIDVHKSYQTTIILVAAFNIVSTLFMVVMEKTKEIAILKSMGATRKSIIKIFSYQIRVY